MKHWACGNPAEKARDVFATREDGGTSHFHVYYCASCDKLFWRKVREAPFKEDAETAARRERLREGLDI